MTNMKTFVKFQGINRIIKISVWSVDLGFFDLFFLFKINFELVKGKGGDLLFDDLDEAGEVFLALCGRERLDQDILIFADLVAFNLFGAAL